jgi:glutamyl/glutaminyl-tRNA synthetase
VYLLEPERGSDDDTRLELRGGCQCGALRYVALVEHDEAYYCHCRMCQRRRSATSLALTSSHLGFFTDDGPPRLQIEDDEEEEEYVARWKAAHGKDSMPGPLLGPST